MGYWRRNFTRFLFTQRVRSSNEEIKPGMGIENDTLIYTEEKRLKWHIDTWGDRVEPIDKESNGVEPLGKKGERKATDIVERRGR